MPKTEDHLWGEATVTKEADCASEGVKTYLCSLCGATKTEAIAKSETHVWDSGRVTKSASVTEEGERTYTCKICGTTEVEAIPQIIAGGGGGGGGFSGGGSSVSSDPPAAVEPGSKGLAFVSNGDGTCYVSGIGTCTDAEIVIPEQSPAGDSVVAIGEKAFLDCANMTSIRLPGTIRSIASNAFGGCEKLVFHSYEGGEYLGTSDNPYFALIRSTSKEIAFCTIHPDCVLLADKAFAECMSLAAITIPNKLARIGSLAFFCCAGLESIAVEEGNTVYHSTGNCLIETATGVLVAGCKNSVIPDDGSVKIIGDAAFSRRAGLSEIALPEGVTEIGASAFYLCEGLLQIALPATLERIDEHAFEDCTFLTTITFAGSIEQWNAIGFDSAGYTVHCTEDETEEE